MSNAAARGGASPLAALGRFSSRRRRGGASPPRRAGDASAARALGKSAPSRRAGALLPSPARGRFSTRPRRGWCWYVYSQQPVWAWSTVPAARQPRRPPARLSAPASGPAQVGLAVHATVAPPPSPRSQAGPAARVLSVDEAGAGAASAALGWHSPALAASALGLRRSAGTGRSVGFFEAKNQESCARRITSAPAEAGSGRRGSPRELGRSAPSRRAGALLPSPREPPSAGPGAPLHPFLSARRRRTRVGVGMCIRNSRSGREPRRLRRGSPADPRPGSPRPARPRWARPATQRPPRRRPRAARPGLRPGS